MEMWKTKPVSHIPTPPTATTDKGQKRRYTNIPLGTKHRSGHSHVDTPWFLDVLLQKKSRGKAAREQFDLGKTFPRRASESDG
jgi:hypothetical protein